MKYIDIEELDEIKEDLETLEDFDVILVNEKDETKFVIMPISIFDRLDTFRNIMEDSKENDQKISIIAGGESNLTYDEYETIKKQLIDSFDKTFKPKADKLN